MERPGRKVVRERENNWTYIWKPSGRRLEGVMMF